MTYALVDMMHHWYRAADDGQSVQALFIDFAKAFDHAEHNILISRLTEFGLPDVIIQWTILFHAHDVAQCFATYLCHIYL